MSRQPRSFFARPVLDVAVDLLGCVVTAKSAAGAVSVRLTEVEAYDGPNDPASHAYRGPTPRTRVMFGRPGFLYVYFTYGMHWCANLVCAPDGTASAVLLRAGEVVVGRELAGSRRPACKADRDLARGPARLAGCLGLRGEDSGADLCVPRSRLIVAPPLSTVDPTLIRSGPRVGISSAADWPWRFWLDGEPSVSGYRPAVRRNRSKSAATLRQTDRREQR